MMDDVASKLLKEKIYSFSFRLEQLIWRKEVRKEAFPATITSEVDDKEVDQNYNTALTMLFRGIRPEHS